MNKISFHRLMVIPFFQKSISKMSFRKDLPFLLFFSLITLSGCIQPFPQKETWVLNVTPVTVTPTMTNTLEPQRTPFLPATREPGKPLYTPTPDAPKVLPTPRSEEEVYTVQWNDSLNIIARNYGVDMNAIVAINQLANPNYLEVGQVLVIPPQDTNIKAPDFKIVPDSELVYGPSGIGFNPKDLIYSFDSYLSSMENSDEVVLQIAEDYSVNPRILLAVLEYATGWVTGPNTDMQTAEISQETEKDAWKTSLYTVVSNIAKSLNYGYYAWKVNSLGNYVLTDGTYYPADETINAGTAAIQYWASTKYGNQKWLKAVSEDGIFNTYNDFFGYPFDFAYEPLIPPGLKQPDLELPFQSGVAWSFTGGPHPGWDEGSAWAALDFAPPGSPMGCLVSYDWVTAVADGVVVRSEFGEVVQDLDGDGNEQTGWVILYMHVDTWERVQSGTYLETGDLIGHASCEGGVSTGTHLHIARKYNGEWIEAVGDVPFEMSGFQAQSSGIEYNGYLVGNGVFVEAWEFYRPESLIQH